MVCSSLVALRKESVDRNILPPVDTSSVRVSLSARRAWIEISISITSNFEHASLSARRAWIEILH